MRTIVIYPYGHLEQTPCVKMLAESAAIYGSTALACIKNESVKDSVFKREDISVFRFGNGVSGFRERYIGVLPQMFFWLVRELRRTRPRHVFLVGERALLFAPVFSLFRCRVTFLSLELYFPEDFSNRVYFSIYRSIKNQILKFVHKVAIQDKNRARLFCALHRWDRDKILWYSNLPENTRDLMALARKDSPVSSKPPQTPKIIYSGSLFARWSGVSDLVEEIEKQERNYTVILHSRITVDHTKDKNHRYINIQFSPENLSGFDYSELIRSCNIGFAYYDVDFTRNIKFAGLSSGKLLHYLALGKPIIVNRIPTWASLVVSQRIGVVIESLSELDDAVVTIMKNYNEFSLNAIKCSEHLLAEAELTFEKLLKD